MKIHYLLGLLFWLIVACENPNRNKQDNTLSTKVDTDTTTKKNKQHLSYQKDVNPGIDSGNYFRFIVDDFDRVEGNELGMGWLNLNDATPIIIEELEKAGYEDASNAILFKIEDGVYIILTAYTGSANFGFLYIEGHNLFPSKAYRKDMTDRLSNGNEYSIFEKNVSGKSKFIKIEKLPSNVFPLNENNYWFQYTDNPSDTIRLLKKETAIRILRQDIKMYLQKAPKPVLQ